MEGKLIDFEACKTRRERLLSLIFSFCLLDLGIAKILVNKELTLLDWLGTFWGLIYPLYEIEIWNWIDRFEKLFNQGLDKKRKEKGLKKQ